MANGTSGMGALLWELEQTLEKLTQTQREIAQAVRSDDLSALSECMKRQQALSLSLRNIDQRRVKLQEKLGLERIRLSELPAAIEDKEERLEVKKAADALSAQYKVMQSAAEVARSSLECSLHEVEKMMTNMGIDPRQVQEQAGGVSGIRTDFHA